MRTSKLRQLCDIFHKKATIEDDMAKRIMLSVLPAVSSPAEVHQTGGFVDYKVLRSAANGAKDLIKYGTRACVEELAFYGTRFLTVANKATDDPEEHDRYMEKYKEARNFYERASKLAYSEKYHEALSLCVQGFSDRSGWDYAFGGEAWKKIAQVLLDLNNGRTQLENLRRESMSPHRDQKKDYLMEEVELLKHQTVLMNVFDGLAHNTGSVIDKLVRKETEEHNPDITEEQKLDAIELGKSLPGGVSSSTTVKRLMDAKELTNPLEVYKVIAPVLEKSPQKHLFKDWVGKLQRHPDYTKQVSSDEALKSIQIKKALIQRFNGVSLILEQLVKLKDKIIGSPEAYRYSILVDINDRIGHLIHYMNEIIRFNMRQPLKDEAWSMSKGLVDKLTHLLEEAVKLEGMLEAEKKKLTTALMKSTANSITDTDITNLIHHIKNGVNRLMYMVEDL